MNVGTFVGIVLVVGVIFFGFNLIIGDFETSLVDTGYVNTTHFNESYDLSLNQTSQITEDFNATVDALQSLGDEGEWWQEIGEFIGAVPIFIIQFPIAIVSTIVDAIGNVTVVLNEIGIPPIIVGAAAVGLIVWLIFKLINFWKSGKEI